MKIVTMAVLVGVCVVLGGCYEGTRRGYGYYNDNPKFAKRDPDNPWRSSRGEVDTRKLYDKMDAADKLGGPKE